jgi:hypothetical protein
MEVRRLRDTGYEKDATVESLTQVNDLLGARVMDLEEEAKHIN